MNAAEKRRLTLAWVAGFFDGEGYVGIVHRKTADKFQLTVSVRQCETEPLNLIKDLFGGTVIVHRPKSKTTRISYSWMVSRRIALRFIEAIEPYVVRPIVRKRIAVGIRFQKQVKASGRKDNAYTERQRAFYEEMNALKMRAGNVKRNQD